MQHLLGRWYLVAVAAVVGFIGCAAPERAPAPVVPESARSAYLLGLQLEAQGSDVEALASLEDALAQAPDYVDAHRAYQNLLLQRDLRGRLVTEYTKLLAEAPGSGVRRYLLGRVLSHHGRQVAAFEDALRADPDLYFAWIGIGYASSWSGDLARAEDAFRRAADLEPDRPEALRGRIEAALQRGDPTALEERVETARRLLEMDPRDDAAMRLFLQRRMAHGESSDACRDAVSFALAAGTDAAADLARRVLQDAGRAQDFDLARARLAPRARVATESAAWLHLLALVEERCGAAGAALFAVERARPAVLASEAGTALHERLLLEAGRVGEWLDAVGRRRFGAGFDLGDGGAAAARFAEARAAVGGAEALRAADLLLGLGLHEGAIRVLRDALDRDPAGASNAAIADRLQETLRHRRFVAEIGSYFAQVYRGRIPRAAPPGSNGPFESSHAPSFDAVVEDLRRISRDCLGENVVDPVVTRRFPLIGEFLDPDPANGGGLARYLDRFGTFAVVGKRVLAAPEAYVLRRVADGRVLVDGEPVYRVVGDDVLVPSRSEFMGTEIAGFAFQTFIVLNVDRARATADRAALLDAAWPGGSADELLADPIPEARDRAARVDVREPLSLASRTLLRAYREHKGAGGAPAAFAGVVLDAVEAHERAHIRDARRFLPLTRGLLDKAALLAKLRFSPARAEAWLEARAQAVALRDASSPRVALATMALMLPNRMVAPPHSTGFADLAASLVAEIAEHPADYPAIERDRVILPQLDRLDDVSLRRLATAVLAEEDAIAPLAATGFPACVYNAADIAASNASTSATVCSPKWPMRKVEPLSLP